MTEPTGRAVAIGDGEVLYQIIFYDIEDFGFGVNNYVDAKSALDVIDGFCSDIDPIKQNDLMLVIAFRNGVVIATETFVRRGGDHSLALASGDRSAIPNPYAIPEIRR